MRTIKGSMLALALLSVVACAQGVNRRSHGDGGEGPPQTNAYGWPLPNLDFRDYCEADVACRGGGPEQTEACLLDQAAEFAYHTVAGCQLQVEALQQCRLDSFEVEGQCIVGQGLAPTSQCGLETVALNQCISAGVDQQPYLGEPITADPLVVELCTKSVHCSQLQGGTSLPQHTRMTECLVHIQAQLVRAETLGCGVVAQQTVQCLVNEGMCDYFGNLTATGCGTLPSC